MICLTQGEAYNKIAVDPNVLDGGSFWFTIPQDGIEVDQLECKQPLTRPNYEPNRSRILIVDDNKNNVELLVEMIEPFCSETSTAENGKEAISHASIFEPDIIIMDIQMPVMNGIDATAAFRKSNHFSKTRIIACSTNADDETKLACKNVGCDAFLEKPLRFNELAQILTDINSSLYIES